MRINEYIVAIRAEISAPFDCQQTHASNSFRFWTFSEHLFLQTSKLLYLFALAMVANPPNSSSAKGRYEIIYRRLMDSIQRSVITDYLQ